MSEREEGESSFSVLGSLYFENGERTRERERKRGALLIAPHLDSPTEKSQRAGEAATVGG